MTGSAARLLHQAAHAHDGHDSAQTIRVLARLLPPWWVFLLTGISCVRGITIALRLRELQDFGRASAQERRRSGSVLPTS